MCDERYMARALQLARRGRFTTAPNPNVGCVIVRDNVVVGEGFHYRAGDAHAEVYALRMAGDKARGATVYVTLEPCSHQGRTPPCCEALIAAGVARVVVAMVDPNPQVAGRGVRRLQQAGIAVSCGLMSSEAELLNVGFLKRMRRGLPWVQLKLAASLDGRTALANGESQWITSPQARADVQHFRACAGAILSSSATVLADDPALTVRWQSLSADVQRDYPPEQVRQPVRVVLDRQWQVTPQHRLIYQPGEVWLVHGEVPCLAGESPAATQSAVIPVAGAGDNGALRLVQAQGQWQKNVRHFIVGQQYQRLDLTALLRGLAELQINTLWVEAGATLAGALLQAQLVDELLVYLAPQLLGDSARGLCCLPGLERLADAPQFVFADVRQVGADLCLHLRPVAG